MRRSAGFSLVEVVAVVTVIAIIAAVATPRLLCVSSIANDNAARQSLACVRDAIERYAVDHGGALPASSALSEAQFKQHVAPYLRDGVPKCPVGPAQNNQVRLSFGEHAIYGQPVPIKGWHYNAKTGDFIVNYSGLSYDGVTKYDAF